MGTDLGELVETEEISFDHMLNKEIGVDAMNTLYQFLSIIRQRDGTPLKDSDGNVTSHLSGLFYRAGNLLEKNIKPVFIFDGEAPTLKEEEAEKRREKREQARKEWKELREKGETEKARKKAEQSSKLTSDMVKEAKKLLDAMGIPAIQAPSEGEAQSAWMNREGQVWAVGSQDWDALLFGADRLVRNLTVTGKRKVPGKDRYRKVVPERITRESMEEQTGVSREKLVWAGILMGTDFNPGGIRGIGPKTAMDLVTEYDAFDTLLEDDRVDWQHENDPHTILDFFMDPPVDDTVSFAFEDPDEDRIRELLVDEHDFSEDRVNSKLENIMDAMKDTQQDLGSFV
ncbi:MAG: flap endonuclease-1 [Candidatus Nanohaloarchaea archaeon]|nr:flap endonuclease-1 [Candidatus Nanohaloarchaea archaeon]